MRRLLTIIASVIVLVGLVIGAYFWWQGRQAASLTVGEGSVTNPFGGSAAESGTGTSAAATSTVLENSIGSPVQVAAKLVEVAKGPVAAGLAMIRVSIAPPAGSASTTASTTDTEVRYVDRASGNVYAYDIHSNKSTRLSNRTVPGAAEASWLADGSVAFLRFITVDAGGDQAVNTYALPASGVGGFALAQGLAQVTAVGSSSVLALSSSDGGTTAVLSDSSGANSKTVLSTPLSQLRAFWTSAGIVMETPPSASMPGYAFTADKTGNLVLVAGPLNGLSILPNHAGTKAIISYLDGTTLRLAELDFATRSLTSLPVSTLADKCVWAPDDQSAYCGVPTSLPSGTIPDDWYQGAMQFSDRIWEINFTGRVAELVANLPALASSPIDVTSLTIDPTSDALGFINKENGSLWTYDL